VRWERVRVGTRPRMNARHFVKSSKIEVTGQSRRLTLHGYSPRIGIRDWPCSHHHPDKFSHPWIL
jgi:hypothetical protein